MTEADIVSLTPAEKKALKAQAHSLDPVVLIGDKGLTENVLKEIEVHLSAHGLIKVRVAGDEREVRLEYAESICKHTGCALVQHIGKLLVLFRPKSEEAANTPKHKARAKPKAPRQTKRQFNSKD